MFLAGDEFGNTQYGNNNCYCQDNEISWLDWSLLEKNRELFEFFQYMIAFRKKHLVIRKRLPDAVCGMAPLQNHNINAADTTIPRDARTLAVSFAGYNQEKGMDDLVYLVVNTYWKDVHITLPSLLKAGQLQWHLYVNTYGDGQGRYFYREGEEVRIDGEFIMRPRSVAVFAVW